VSGRPRNFSPWAYWRLHLDSVVAADPCPREAAQIDEWRVRVRDRLISMLGPAPQRVPAHFEVTESVDAGDYRRMRVVYDTEMAMSVPAFLLVPHGRTAPGPAVLAVHGHGAGKAMVCGVDDGDDRRSAEIAEYGGAYAHELACRGFVVLAPDLRCFGERADPVWDEPAKYECDWNLVAATMAGQSPLAQNLWDLRCSLDVLADHELVDPAALGVCGLSYGATLTLFLAALDDRVRACVVSGYLSSWRAAHTVPWNMCGSQVLTGMLGQIEHLDVAALVSPRAMLVESGTDDFIFPIAAARETVASLAEIYAHDGAADHLEHDEFAGGHRWHGARAYDFLAEHLR
jgi:dienelactone hydrolase